MPQSCAAGDFIDCGTVGPVVSGTLPDAIGSLALLGKEALKKSSVKELEIMFARAEREGQRLGDCKEAEQWFAYAKEVLAELSSRS